MTAFDPVFYLAGNPDVAAAGVAPLAHFQAFGQAEGRNPDAVFNTAYYLAHNPDVAAAVASGATTALQHYLAFGWREGRDPSAAFSTTGYLAAEADVAAAAVNPLVHYLSYGRFEGRRAVPVAGGGVASPALAKHVTVSGTGTLTLGSLAPGSTVGFVAPNGFTLTGGDSGALTLTNATNLHLGDNAAHSLALHANSALAGVNNEVWPAGSGNPSFPAPSTLTLDLTQTTLASATLQFSAVRSTIGLPATATGTIQVIPDGGTTVVYEPTVIAGSRTVTYAPAPPASTALDPANAGPGSLTVIGFNPAVDALDLGKFGLGTASLALAAAGDAPAGVMFTLPSYTISLSGVTKSQLRNLV